MQDLSTEIRQMIDAVLAEEGYGVRQKADRTWVTDLDLAIERRVKGFLLERYPGLVHVGEEEESSHRESYDFSGDYLVIDPIDGTENFIAGTGLFGSMLSLRVGDEELHMIYLPARDVFITNHTLDMDATCGSDITLLSTKCMRQPWDTVDSFRVIGSSAVMFAMLLQGQAQRYRYCVGAKVWDCYTGIRLAQQLGLDIRLTGRTFDDWMRSPPHRTEFEIAWKP